MRQSDSIANLAAALVVAQSEMGAAKKSAQNPHLRNKYADLSAVWEAVSGPLHAHGIAVVQGVSGDAGTVTVSTRLLHTSGEWVEDAVTLPYLSNKGINECQAAGSAITYARRYGLSAMLSLPTEDDDGSGAGAPRTQTAPPPTDRRAAGLEAVKKAALGKGIADDSLSSWCQDAYGEQSVNGLDVEQLTHAYKAITTGLVEAFLNDRVPS